MNSPLRSDAPSRWIVFGVGAALLALAVATGLEKILSTDYWWHLRTGYWIAETGAVPRADVFTYSVPDARWIDVHWLFQLALAGVHSVADHAGVVVVKAALVALLVAILATVGWRRERPFVAGLGLGAMLLVASERFRDRPELLSFVLLAGVVALLARDRRRNDALVYAIVPLQLLWANVHGLFALGIALCAIELVSEQLRAAREPARSGRAQRLLRVVVLACLASFANPNFADGALYPLRQLGMIGPGGDDGMGRGYNLELVPLWHPAVPRAMAVAPAALALACAAAIAANWRRNRDRSADLLAFAAFLALGLMANRNLALFAIVAAPLFVRNANEWLDGRMRSAWARHAANAAVAAALLIAAVDVARGSYHARIGTVHERGVGVVGLYVPALATDWIERERPPGPIAHHMWDGGYLSWRLHPRYEVLVDGRLEIYGPKKLAALRFVTPREFLRLDAKYRFGTVLLNPTFHARQLIAWFYARPDWRLVQGDESGLVFVRAEPDGSFRWPPLDVDSPAFLRDLAGERGSMQSARRRVRIQLLRALDRKERARAESLKLAARRGA